ncbi:hypothetical protein, partial [Pandoraea terrae]|uniref:hypothetical protein n=1 Tax=Pandoraea terrae TaxID=1537710 RepID=UPI003B834B92
TKYRHLPDLATAHRPTLCGVRKFALTLVLLSIILMALVFGIVYASILKKRKPTVFAAIGRKVV